MLLSMVSYQLSASMAKQLIEQLDPITVTILRLGFAAIIVGIIFKSWRILSQLSQLKWRDLLCYSFALGLMNTLFYVSLGKLPQGIAVGLEFIGPLGLAFLSIKHKNDLFWVLLACMGIALMVPWTMLNQLEFSFFGASCALGAGLCWALYIYFGQRVVQQNIGMHALTIAISLSVLFLLPIGIGHHPQALIQIQFWPQALLIAILATAIPYSLDLLALKQLSSMSYGTLSSLSPVLAALSGFIFLNEYLTLLQWLSLFLIMMASIGITLKEHRQQKMAE
ncbi:EamA family transporter [Acinetobacter apis]